MGSARGLARSPSPASPTLSQRESFQSQSQSAAASQADAGAVANADGTWHAADELWLAGGAIQRRPPGQLWPAGPAPSSQRSQNDDNALRLFPAAGRLA